MKLVYRGFFKILALILVLLAAISCSKMKYYFEQGLGQLKIQNRARPNEIVLKDPRVPKKHKDKIKEVQQYKKFFYQYFDKEESPIYDQTFFLEDEAVTFLVVVSPIDKIEAKLECFTFLGCFPYLGFFNEKSAEDYIEKMEQLGFATFKRPVYAYSSLGYFVDPILSSFFMYDKFELGELVFHELFHTIFFIKNEVELNENLANYFGKELALEYFNFNTDKREAIKNKSDNYDKLALKIVELSSRLQSEYENSAPLNKNSAGKILEKFLRETFYPEITSYCEELGVEITNCFPLNRKWNNAQFAAYLTYEAKKDLIHELRVHLNLDLKGLLGYLIGRHREFENLVDKSLSFSEYLFSPLEKVGVNP